MVGESSEMSDTELRWGKVATRWWKASGTVVRDRQAFRSGDHLGNAELRRTDPRRLEEAVDRVVAAAGIVVEQRERPHVGLLRDLQREVDGAVAPVLLLLELLRRVLRVVDEQVGAVAQLE